MPTTQTSPAPRARAKQTPPTLVLFVRHGTTPTTGQVLPGRAPGLHLSDAGRAQAKRVAERLATWVEQSPPPPATGRGRRRQNGDRSKSTGLRLAAVYASPMERTRETASPIAAALGLRVAVRRGLIECDFGEWTGAELKTLFKKPEWTTVQRFPSGFGFPGGESFSGMQARMVETTAALVAEHPGEAIVAVSHADPIKAVVAAALGTHLDLFQRIVISPCSVTAISYGTAGPTVLAVNSTGSLKELRPS
ncbi:MAG: histidine phosphatase family protein [Acidimicrobiaceae bacterium]|nr:histidine phosphatase family protein [Acidimicrobiaceae bacterium]MBO0748556.1 histidine phosphatase family protein [Acidimicrobiaceae bacterium]